MNCMKCGVEIEAGQVFCQDCLADMAKYPVKPGTAVQLPRIRETAPVKKAPYRRAPSPEEQVKSLKKLVRILSAGWLITLALLAALAYYTVDRLLEEEFLPGQNYSSVTSIDPDVSRETSAPTTAK